MRWILIPLLASSLAAQNASRPSKHLCEVTVRSDAELARLFDAASDPDDHADVRDGTARIYADSSEVVRLTAMGFDVTIVQRDL